MTPVPPLPSNAPPVVVELRDGRCVTLREVRPDDAASFSAAFARLSADARYNRFFAALRELPPSALDRAVRPVAELEFALVAVSGRSDDGEIVGGGRYFVEADGSTCEFSITVADDCRRIGLASHLLQALMAAARSRGLKRMRGYVLASNVAMLGLARRFGFEVTQSDAGPTIRLVSTSLA